MMYWDAAPILKLYTSEHDSHYFTKLAASTAEPILSSAVADAEVLSTLYRKEHAGDLRAGGAVALFRDFRADCRAGQIVLIPFSGQVMAEAERLVALAFRRPRPVMIRAIDLIHVASAVAGKAASLVATDARLREVARLAGLPLLP